MHVYKCQQIKRYINNNILIVLDKKKNLAELDWIRSWYNLVQKRDYLFLNFN